MRVKKINALKKLTYMRKFTAKAWLHATISSDEVYKPRKARSRRTTFRTRELVRVATALHV